MTLSDYPIRKTSAKSCETGCRISSESYPGSQECVANCHGAAGQSCAPHTAESATERCYPPHWPCTRPRHDQPPLVQHQTECAADNPAMVRHAFAADLRGTAAFAHGVDQRDARGVDDPEHGRGGQEDLRPVLMGHEEAKEPRPLGEPREQRAIVARQPAIEGPVADAFERMQQPQGNYLTGPEVGLRVFGEA